MQENVGSDRPAAANATDPALRRRTRDVRSRRHVAIRIDRLGAAEMSCIASLGGDVAPLP